MQEPKIAEPRAVASGCYSHPSREADPALVACSIRSLPLAVLQFAASAVVIFVTLD